MNKEQFHKDFEEDYWKTITSVKEPINFVWGYVNINLKISKDVKGDFNSATFNIHKRDLIDTLEYTKLNIYENETTKIIEIKEELKSMLFETDNAIKFRRLPYNKMFINTNIRYKDVEIKGIYLEWREEINDIFIIGISLDHKNELESYFRFNYLDNETMRYNFEDKKSEKDSNKVMNKMRVIVSNILDFLNNPEMNETIELVDVKRNDKTNLKRLKKNKCPIQDRVFIRPSRSFADYVKDFNQKKELDYSFIVRGHFRHLKSDRYKEAKGKSIWVYPFIKNKDKPFKNKIAVISK